MQLKYDDLLAVKGTGLLPVFAYALIAALVIGAAGGGWSAWRITKGAAAIKENKRLTSDIKALTKAAKDLRDRAVASDLAYRAATKRMTQIAQEREDEREEIRRERETQREALEQLLDQRPDLRTERAGDDVLRHWRKGNSKPGAGSAPATPPGKPDAAVPRPAAAGKRPVGHTDRQPRPGRLAVPRLPERARQADRRGARMGGDSLGVVLHGGRTCRHQGTGLCA